MDSGSGVGRVLAETKTLQDQYGSYYKKSARAADLSQLPLIGAAALAARYLLHNGTNAAKDVGYISVGAGTYGATRNVLFPSSMVELYIKGHAALSCIRNEGALFAGTSALNKRNNLVTLATALLGHQEDAKVVYYGPGLSVNATNDQKSTFQNGMRQLGEALATAATTLRATEVDLGAYDSAEFVFDTTVSAVATRVASKGREGRGVDFAKLKETLSADIPKPAVPAVAPIAPLTDDQIIQSVTRAASELNSAIQDVNAASPHYGESLARVTACPSSI